MSNQDYKSCIEKMINEVQDNDALELIFELTQRLYIDDKGVQHE